MLTSIAIDSLTTLGGQLDIENDISLTTLATTNLATVGASVVIGDNTALVAVNLPATTSITGSIYAGSNSSLTTFTAPLLANVGYDVLNSGIFVYESPSLPVCEITAIVAHCATLNVSTSGDNAAASCS